MGLVNKLPAEFALSSKPLMQLSLCLETRVLGYLNTSIIRNVQV